MNNTTTLLNERSLIELTDDQEKVYVQHFMSSGMRPRQSVTLHTYGPSTLFTEQGKDVDKVYLLLEGKVNITVDKTHALTPAGGIKHLRRFAEGKPRLRQDRSTRKDDPRPM